MKSENIYIIIILILLYKLYKWSCENYSNQLKKKERFDSNLMYGTTIGHVDTKYDFNYMNKYNTNKIDYPNSKVALDRLMKKGAYSCRNQTLGNSGQYSDHVINKIHNSNKDRKKKSNINTLRNSVDQSN